VDALKAATAKNPRHLAENRATHGLPAFPTDATRLQIQSQELLDRRRDAITICDRILDLFPNVWDDAVNTESESSL
jgi:hypothetical protein